jgi:hypothetical protein
LDAYNIGIINFTRDGINKTINSAKGDTDILKALVSIREIVKQGKNLGERDANKERTDRAIFIGIELYINLEKKKRKVTALIKKYPNNLLQYYVIYLDLDKKK